MNLWSTYIFYIWQGKKPRQDLHDYVIHCTKIRNICDAQKTVRQRLKQNNCSLCWQFCWATFSVFWALWLEERCLFLDFLLYHQDFTDPTSLGKWWWMNGSFLCAWRNVCIIDLLDWYISYLSIWKKSKDLHPGFLRIWIFLISFERW